ncbi:SusC/RagA family TonB-linked outer membrane protein [Autumnicola musiva]|uniref:SusC/RagA family TonB-linked outer membrane protein n=1 Tax=Autumnicola musiva TaxID=3075589 RepID=A0ABU3DAC9_9FLAO|nr:SusC/RagA family TonB-linked outer membrane protein [Zunongwangia sp. F117]MDT0678493.1 SusC/RagA family TonB-linked outer membrane protein [Zunongwangia sp. F117]
MNIRKSFYLILTCITMYTSYAQANSNIAKLNIKLEKALLKEIFSELHTISGYTFNYGNNVNNNNNRYDAIFKDKSLKFILNDLSREAGFKYWIEGRNINISATNPQQLIEVRGRVYETQEKNEPLPGVNISIKNKAQGTITNMGGYFEIEASLQDTLVFSMIGYKRHEYTVTNSSDREIEIVLQEDVNALGEVIVMGYGTQEKSEVTSAVSSISEEEFNRGNVNDAYTLMQGKIPGLSISKVGSNPNAGSTIRLRGVSTLGGNSEPLVVVDGVIGMNLNGVDPNDIKSVEVLKDASAAAIYGSRASSGVILITTKKGKEGKDRIEYNTYVSVEEVANTIPVMSAQEYREREIGPDFGYNTNWTDEISRTAISHSHNLALTGGSKKTVYRASLNYRDIQGIALNTGFDRLNARLNLTHNAWDDRLAVTMNFTGTMLTSEGANTGAFRQATIYNPTAPVRSDDPEYEQYGGYFQQTLYNYFNPVALLEQDRNERQTNLLNLNLQAELKPLNNLSILARYSRQRYMRENASYTSKFSLGTGLNRNGYASRDEDKSNNYLFESTATFDDEFGDFDVKALVGYSYQEFVNNGFNVNAGNFLTDIFRYHNLGAALDFENGLANGYSYQNSSKIIGFFGRLNIDYQDTYFLTASLRREGSTMFGKGNKWGDFPAVSGGIDIGNLINEEQINNLKLRASYGVTGNTPSSPYLSLQTLSPQGNFYYNGEWIPTYGPSSNPNPNLRWEKKAEFDVGVDFQLLNNRLSGSFDYYKRSTTDLIYPLSVPVPPNLVDITELNIGEITGSGLEALIEYDAIRSTDFSWTTSLNGAYLLENTLVSLSDEEAGLDFGGRRYTSTLGVPGLGNVPATIAIEGEELGLLWGYRNNGLNEEGLWEMQDLNGDGIIDGDDETIIGNGLPDFHLGFRNTFTWGNFDLDVFFRGSFGHDLVNANRAFYENQSGGGYNIVKTKYFNEELQDVPTFSDFYVENGDFVMLDNATLGYNFSIANSFFSNLRLYLTGQNLFVITDYTGVDPEVRQDNPLAAGIDGRNTWLRSKTYTLGLQVQF